MRCIGEHYLLLGEVVVLKYNLELLKELLWFEGSKDIFNVLHRLMSEQLLQDHDNDETSHAEIIEGQYDVETKPTSCPKCPEIDPNEDGGYCLLGSYIGECH
jgi:hypothetical protein